MESGLRAWADPAPRRVAPAAAKPLDHRETFGSCPHLLGHAGANGRAKSRKRRAGDWWRADRHDDLRGSDYLAGPRDRTVTGSCLCCRLVVGNDEVGGVDVRAPKVHEPDG